MEIKTTHLLYELKRLGYKWSYIHPEGWAGETDSAAITDGNGRFIGTLNHKEDVWCISDLAPSPELANSSRDLNREHLNEAQLNIICALRNSGVPKNFNFQNK